jgi:cyanophycinase-like exopeptidase
VAIDEGTCVEVSAGAGELRVYGAGSAYRVRRAEAGGVVVALLA